MNLLLLGVAAILTVAHSSPCSSYQTCQDCLGKGSFCGWCSPSSTVFTNGTEGSRCQDQHETDWHCNHLYSTGSCQRGYTCNATSGQCQLTDAGSGDTLKNCEASCHKQPKDLSVCNTSTLTCEPCKDYCTSDSDCPGSYCKAGLCAHSRCQAQSSCNASCAAVPQEIIGVWRGVQIQEGYGSGEYDLRFNNSVNSSQVQFRGPQGDVSNGDVEATPGTQNLVLTFTSGPLENTILRGLYSPWEPSVDTLTMAYAFGAPNEDAPDSIETAMKGNGSTVYVLSSCNPHTDTKHCDFSSSV